MCTVTGRHSSLDMGQLKEGIHTDDKIKEQANTSKLTKNKKK